MNHPFVFDLANCSPVNYLWPQLVNSLGIDRSQRAVSQALDLQSMRGNKNTIPVLIVETCGLALIESSSLREHMGFIIDGEAVVLIVSTKDFSFQLIYGH